MGFCEKDEFARKSYKAIQNTEGEIEWHDITRVSDDDIRRVGQVDIITAGFPDWAFDRAQKVNSDSQLYKQAGNRVTVDVVREIAKRIKENEI